MASRRDRILSELPPEFRSEVEQGYWNDWVEQNERERERFEDYLRARIHQHLQEEQGAAKGLAKEVSHLAEAVTSKQRNRAGYIVKEVAEMVGVSEWTVRRWIHDGKLAATRCKERDPFIITPEALQEFMEHYGSGITGQCA